MSRVCTRWAGRDPKPLGRSLPSRIKVVLEVWLRSPQSGLAGTVRRGAKWGSGLDVFGRGPTTAPETPVGRPASERHCTFFPYGPRLRHRLKALHYLIHNAGRLTTC